MLRITEPRFTAFRSNEHVELLPFNGDPGDIEYFLLTYGAADRSASSVCIVVRVFV